MRKKTFIIANEFDRPCSKLVAVIIGQAENETVVDVQYIPRDTHQLDFQAVTKRMTFVEDFGIELEFSNGEVSAVKVGPSKATYSNGKPREWQDTTTETSIALKPQFAAFTPYDPLEQEKNGNS